MDVLCTFKIKIESQNLEHGHTKDQPPYSNQDQDIKPQSGSSSIVQTPKLGIKGHGCSLHLQNQDRDQIFGIWVYQRLVNIFKSISECRTPVRNLQCPPKSKISFAFTGGPSHQYIHKSYANCMGYVEHSLFWRKVVFCLTY